MKRKIQERRVADLTKCIYYLYALSNTNLLYTVNGKEYFKFSCVLKKKNWI